MDTDQQSKLTDQELNTIREESERLSDKHGMIQTNLFSLTCPNYYVKHVSPSHSQKLSSSILKYDYRRKIVLTQNYSWLEDEPDIRMSVKIRLSPTWCYDPRTLTLESLTKTHIPVNYEITNYTSMVAMLVSMTLP